MEVVLNSTANTETLQVASALLELGILPRQNICQHIMRS